MNPYLAHMTDRDLLEQIYILLLQVNNKVNDINDDNKQFSMNLAADLLGNILDDQASNNRRNDQTGNNR